MMKRFVGSEQFQEIRHVFARRLRGESPAASSVALCRSRPGFSIGRTL